MTQEIFAEIENCASTQALFDLIREYFRGQGFGSIAYVVPPKPTRPFVFIEQGMPPDFVAEYRGYLHRSDPMPAQAFRHARPARLSALIAQLPALTADELAFLEALKTAGLSDTLIMPCYGPFGRAGVVVIDSPAASNLIDEMDVPLAGAVAQAMHTRMELLQTEDPTPGLSPREREIIAWLCKGKSTGDIATILDLKAPTVTTHIQRIYAKLGVHDRVSACAQASARHYL